MTNIVLEETSDLSGNGKKSLLRGVNGAALVTSSGAVTQAVPDFASAPDLLAAYGDFAGIAAGDFVTRVQTSNGQVITALSGGPLQVGESVIELDVPVNAPCSLELEASAIRARHQFATISLYSNGSDLSPDVVPNPISITSVSQSTAVDGAAYTAVAGTVVTVVLDSPVPGENEPGRVYLSDFIHISGLTDTRLNYPNATINFISADRKTLCFGYSDEAALPSLAVTITPAVDTAYVNFYNNAAGAHHGAGYRFTGTTATSAAIWTMFGGGDAQISGTLFTDHRVTVGSTAPVYANGKMGNYELGATSRFRIDVTPDAVSFYSRPRDSTTGWTNHAVRTAVKPGVAENLRTRFRLYQPLNMTRPIGSIVTVSKAGSTTWTVTTEAAHSLVTGNYVTIKGVRDQTNFAAFATPAIVTVTGANTFTLIGTTGTATSHGGSVILCNGGVDQPGIIGQVVSTMSNYTVNPDWIVVAGNTTWAGLAVGDYINIHGNHDDATGADVGVTGAWEVASLVTSTMVIKPIYNIFGVRVSPVTPTLTGTVNCGGSVILRTTLRAHDLQLKQLQGETMVGFDGQGTVRADKAMPVAIVSGNPTTMTATQGTAAAISSTDGTGGWFVRPGIVGLPDIASAALTTTTTTASIANALGNAFQVVIPVTAVAGTNPTLDVRIEESFDGGTNWEPLFDLPRIIAAGHYFSPVLMGTGRNIRYVQTVGGTGSPSFTRSITRNILPFQTAVPTRQYFDRSIVLTTLSSVTPGFCVDGTVDLKLTINIGAATTAPVLQLQISEDKTNWVDVGSPLTAVASSTVQTVAYGVLGKFARAVVKTAGVTVTAGYVQIKGF